MSGPGAPVFAGVDIGGTTTQVVLCDEELKVLDRADTATPARSGGRAMIAATLDALAVVRARTPAGWPPWGWARPEWSTRPPVTSWWPATRSRTGPVSR